MFDKVISSVCASIKFYNQSHLKNIFKYEIDDLNLKSFYISADQTKWVVNINSKQGQENNELKDIKLDFELIEGKADDCSVGIDFKIFDWSDDNYLVMPSAVYAGNRFKSRCLDYPPLLKDPEDIGVDVATIITDVPRLNIAEGQSRIQQLSRDLATPAVGIYFPNIKKGLWLLTEQNTAFGDFGLFVEESDDRKSLTISVTAPGVREDVCYHGNKMNMPSKDCGANLVSGDKISIPIRIYDFACSDIPALFDKFISVRNDFNNNLNLKCHIPFSAAFEILEKKYNDQNWNELGFYNVGINSADNPVVYNLWQLGWVGGMMVTHPLLFEGDELSRQRALQNFDFFFNKTQAPSGFFYGMSDGEKFYSDGFFQPHAQNWHLIRRSSDALYFVIKQFLLLEKQNCDGVIGDTWVAGVQKLCDAFVRLWEKYGQFGQFIDIQTGDIVVGGSTAAAIAPAGLALASRYLNRPKYLDVAIAAAKAYYQKFVLAGVTTGGPGEICQCPDSESAFGLLESFIVLYEITGQSQWLVMAVDMANQCSSWCVSYDFKFPSNSLFGQLDMRTTGSVWANVQNKHSAPNICTLSGDSLFKLFRATGNRLYLEVIRQIAHNQVQYLSRADRPIGKLPSGWMNERVNLSDWAEGVGEIFFGSCWPEVSTLLSCVELPGLYIQPDTGFVCAIDNIKAELLSDADDKITIKIINPTHFDADVKSFVENSDETLKVLGPNYLFGCQNIKISSESEFILKVDKTSKRCNVE